MSGDQRASSFGDSTAQPPTPTRTPTAFPSHVFETPKNDQGTFESSTDWTPRFAEEYSVFNSTPGNLRGPNERFVEFGAPLIPYSGPGHKRSLSTGLAPPDAPSSHAEPSSPRPQLLPPAEPQRRSPPSPDALAPPAVLDQSSKKSRRGVSAGNPGQTATPPPTARKGERKLAPRLDANKMQNDQPYGQPDYAETSHPPNMASFASAPGDMFSYPLSAPAGTPGFAGQRGFWDADQSMMGMDLDLGAMGADIFQTPTPGQRAGGPSLNWGGAGEMYQDAVGGIAPPPNQENSQPASQGRPATSSKPTPTGNLNTSIADQSMYTGTYPTPTDDPFGYAGNSGGGVDPGLLFSRPPSSGIDASFDPGVMAPTSALSTDPRTAAHSSQPPPPSTAKTPTNVRRSVSVREMGTGKQPGRATASSPTKKPALQPGLSRSASENRGNKSRGGRATLPSLAPASRPLSRASASSGVGASRQTAAPPKTRPNTGRSSPLKSHHGHHRLSSLSSIPEALAPRTRTQAKFTIDANGKARVETTVVTDEAPPSTVRRWTNPRRSSQWNSSEDDDDSSSEDDDPIIIPSRNTSFALPDPRKPTAANPFFDGSQRSIGGDRGTSSHGTRPGLDPLEDGQSEAETVVDEHATPASRAGDAASELRKLRESRQRRTPWSASSGAGAGGASKPRRFSAGPPLGAGFAADGYGDPRTLSPTTLTDASLPTPSTGSRSHGLRCVCDSLEADGDGFMVQCERCEMWLHGSCVNLCERTRPAIYICAFCANTPNQRGGRARDGGRAFGSMGPPGPASSPLAHKSFKFR